MRETAAAAAALLKIVEERLSATIARTGVHFQQMGRP
jgi:hypothetical protein